VVGVTGGNPIRYPLRAAGLALSLALAALALAAGTAGTAGTGTGTDAGIDARHSTIVATFKQESVPVDAPFRKFSGHIAYDATHPAAASASIDVETGSFDIGDAAYNAEVRKPAWFNSAAFPMAAFRSTAVKVISATRFEATGNLSIKGRSVVITVPITVTASANSTAFDGTVPVSRKAFGIGDPVWNDVIDDQVSVHFHLVNAGH
jgi:polyisoprenoid-binding protein YceI